MVPLRQLTAAAAGRDGSPGPSGPRPAGGRGTGRPPREQLATRALPRFAELRAEVFGLVKQAKTYHDAPGART
ncbi:hypothetical protein [Streptomyces marincola]|uniref:Uncharacterized protein n=1 Tax=Streptomyces marincola TaxID=2878388 RepID=A0A1W7D1R7_9ACTN|nr:hypothetical protein [Streptomyces marincola]ARQ70954.1 hypothetical protein CAG99_20790 [Streptomyces marincola]